MKKSTARWIPAIAVPALVVAGAVAVPAMANASVKLPQKPTAQIVALTAKSGDVAFSGTVAQTANLGLPDISAFSGSGGGSSSSSNDLSDALAMLTGTHSAKVYVDGTKSRIQTLDDLAERDVIRNGDSVWAYDSKTNEAVHATVPVSSKRTAPLTQESAVPQTPSEVVDGLLTKIGSTTTVSTTDNVMIAGQKAYEIVLTPKDTTTLVGSVTVAVDASTGVPLRAQIKAAGQKDPAYSVEFTSIKYATPAASTFAFTPPAGAEVTKLPTAESSRFEHPLTQQSATDKAERKAALAAAAPTVIGSGWSSVVAATLPSGALTKSDSSGMLDQVLTRVDGGRVLQTALLSVYVTDAGRVYAGAVPASALEAAAAQK